MKKLTNSQIQTLEEISKMLGPDDETDGTISMVRWHQNKDFLKAAQKLNKIIEKLKGPKCQFVIYR